MGLRCIKIYLNDEIPEEAAILEAWDNCPEKRRSALGRAWLLGSLAKPMPKAPKPANITEFPPGGISNASNSSEGAKTPLEKATKNFLSAFG